MTPELRGAIEELRVRFARHGASRAIEGCPCCVRPEWSSRLVRGRPEDVDDELLGRYAFKAMTTWGTRDHFLHLLPTIFARLPGDRLGLFPQIVYGKLILAEWHAWPAPEREAVVNFTHAWHGAAISTGGMVSEAGEILECAARASMSLSPMLDAWSASDSVEAAAAIASAAIYGQEWNFAEDEALKRSWRSWLLGGPARDRLLRTFEAHIDHPDAGDWAYALDLLESANV
jgi:hypothetical protein